MHLWIGFAIIGKIAVIIGVIPKLQEVAELKKKLVRLLNPSAGIYFLVLLCFGVAAALVGHYILAGVELAITLLMVVVYLLFRNHRRNQPSSAVQNIV